MRRGKEHLVEMRRARGRTGMDRWVIERGRTLRRLSGRMLMAVKIKPITALMATVRTIRVRISSNILLTMIKLTNLTEDRSRKA